MLILQRGVFEDLVRNTIVNASLSQLSMEEEVLLCGEPFQLLVLVSCFIQDNIAERFASHN